MPHETARSRRAPDAGAPDASAAGVAARLHSAAIHLLRRLRTVDDASGLTAPRLSALSVVVFGGPQSVSSLARAEQVRLPTMTRLVQGLQHDGLVTCNEDAADRRRVVVRATARGVRLLHAGRARRVEALTAQLADVKPADLKCLDRAATLLETLQPRTESSPRP
jgi:DNA-binding MarR family transcriptional regulator